MDCGKAAGSLRGSISFKPGGRSLFVLLFEMADHAISQAHIDAVHTGQHTVENPLLRRHMPAYVGGMKRFFIFRNFFAKKSIPDQRGSQIKAAYRHRMLFIIPVLKKLSHIRSSSRHTNLLPDILLYFILSSLKSQKCFYLSRYLSCQPYF
jgi:hypothetical protein